MGFVFFFFFSSRRRHTRLQGDWSSDVCSSDLQRADRAVPGGLVRRSSRSHGRGACGRDRKSTRLNSSHLVISYAVFCLKKKNKQTHNPLLRDAYTYTYSMPLHAAALIDIVSLH